MATLAWPEKFRKAVPPEQGTPVFRNITVRNLKAKHCATAGHLVGLPLSPVRDITLENVELEADKAFTIRNVVGLRFKNVKINGQAVEPARETAAGAQTAGK